MKTMTLLHAVLALALSSVSGVVAAAQRPVVAVASFTNESSGSTQHWWNRDIGKQLGQVLSNELMATGAFLVVERQRLGAVLAEQDLAASGRVRKGSGAATGNITGARYLVTGAISSYTEDTSKSKGGLNFRGFHLGGSKTEAYIAIDLRVIDAETSQVVYARTVEGRSSSSGMSLGGRLRNGLGGNFENEDNVPAGKAVRAALIEATDYLACVMVDRTSRCLNKYQQREQRRRDSGRDLLDLD